MGVVNSYYNELDQRPGKDKNAWAINLSKKTPKVLHNKVNQKYQQTSDNLVGSIVGVEVDPDTNTINFIIDDEIVHSERTYWIEENTVYPAFCLYFPSSTIEYLGVEQE